MRVLPRDFYARSPEVVAPELLGKLLVRPYRNTLLIGEITEVEAYMPFGDAASHGSLPRALRRESLYKEGGHAYVYAMRHHYLFNTVTEGTDRPGGVLVRSIAPVKGKEIMMRLRNKDTEKDLSNGPAKVCQAMGITLQFDGIDLTSDRSMAYVAEAEETVARHMVIDKRIGITKNPDALLRFYVVP
jgi:DNA-3-methyladenine glycosylase